MDFAGNRELLLKGLEDALRSGEPGEIDEAFGALAEQVNMWTILRQSDEEIREAFLLPLWRRLRAYHAQLMRTDGVAPAFAARLLGQMDLIRYLVHNPYGIDFRGSIQQNQGLLDALEKNGPQTMHELVPAYDGDPWEEDCGIKETLESLCEDEAIRPVEPPTDPPTYELTPYGRGALADLRLDP